MSETRPDLATVRRMLDKARRRRRLQRCIAAITIVLLVGAAAAYLLLQTELFADVYRQLVADLGLV